MADVINIVTGQELYSVHTPMYAGNPDWEVNPTNMRRAEIKASVDLTPEIPEWKIQLESQYDAKARNYIVSMGFAWDGNTVSTSESKQRRLEALDGRVQRGKVPFTNGLKISAENLKQIVFTDQSQWDTFADAYFNAILAEEQNIIAKKVELGVLNTKAEIEEWITDNL